MKLYPLTARPRNSRRGSTMLIVMGLLGLMIAMITADFIATRGLDRELKLIEKRQTQRLEGRLPAGLAPATNRPVALQN